MNKHTLYDCATKSAQISKCFTRMGDIKTALDALENRTDCTVTIATNEKTVTFTTNPTNIATEPTENYLNALYAELATLNARCIDDLSLLMEQGE